jgi:hypothetical protein
VRLAFAFLLALNSIARADDCRTVEITFNPVPNLQIAVWIEDPNGKYIDTAFVTRSTGTLGLANRPGNGLFKTDFRYPYGRREMVLPVWAHTRNHPYGYVVMGGAFGNSMSSCSQHGIQASECDDQTIGYHFSVSSDEPFFCSPRGGITSMGGGVDVMACASRFYGSKGAYADAPAFSLYPPRSDLSIFEDDHDSKDAHGFASVNDLGAVSGATPAAKLDPPIRWKPPADGQYVLKVEVSQEADFNTYHHHPNVDDEHSELNGYGHDFLGQPSIVYALPFTVGADVDVELTQQYAGYGDWDGSTGTLHPPDMTISTDDGTGAGRLQLTTDSSGAYRVKVKAGPCMGGTCSPPDPPTELTLTPHPNALEVSWKTAAGGSAASRFDLRYRDSMAISENDFVSALAGSEMPPPPGDPGSMVTTVIGGLRPTEHYYVAVRAVTSCDADSTIVTADTTTLKANFATLSGCFIATAAFGSSLAVELDALRTLRDRRLVTNPLGALSVAAYYALSPPLARAISTDEHLRAAARTLLRPIVALARYSLPRNP